MNLLSECVICNVSLKRSQSKEQHIHECAKNCHITDDSLKQLIAYRIQKNGVLNG